MPKPKSFEINYTKSKYILRPWRHGGWELVEYRYFPASDQWKQRQGWAKYVHSHFSALKTVLDQLRTADDTLTLGDPNILTKFEHIHERLINEAVSKLVIISPNLSKQPPDTILKLHDTPHTPKRQNAPTNVF